MIITLDGPAGVGKSTLAKKLAQHFNIPCLDTGAMYRSIGLSLGVEVADMSDIKLEEKLAQFSFALCPAKTQNFSQTKELEQNIEYVLTLNNKPIGEEIRTEKVGRLAAIVASLPLVRKALQGYQREIGEKSPLVTEGRDMGTSVFPKAKVKFFLDATPQVRAQRRFLELQAKNSQQSHSYEEILLDINTRDHKDRNRPIDPLKPAQDAMIVDTSNLNQEQVFEKLVCLIENKMECSTQKLKKILYQQIYQQEGHTMKKSTDTCHSTTCCNKQQELEFSHLNKDGALSMVAVEHKPQTLRKALAYGFVRMTKQTTNLLKAKALPKGDVLSVAKVAGIMGAKRTSDSIPLCHPILLSYVDIRFNVLENGVAILAEVRTCHNTGVEMEAIMAVQMTAATIYDMVKAVQKDMSIEDVHLLYKEGGKTLFKAHDYSDALLKQFS